ncbi:MAG: erythromycin esterase family protein [Verrucomicrobiaceae bacterium]|nr:MAG: erythromycin esterase family protein [Verrucomicrobiaceae bacterium]
MIPHDDPSPGPPCAEAWEAIRREARLLDPETDAGLEELCDAVGDARVVLIGEATHGTHEFYALRAALTRMLITKKGFSIVAVEADWPDAFRAHRYAAGQSEDSGPAEALSDFQRFPLWMWRNSVVAEFLEWLKTHNRKAALAREPKAGFFGLDLYSLHSSIGAVLDYLDKTDPDAARGARNRYRCLGQFGPDPRNYGRAAVLGEKESCEEEVMAQLIDLMARRQDLITKDGAAAGEEFFSTEQNARLIKNAEAYYRSLYQSHRNSWNLRDSHMFEILGQLLERERMAGGKAVVWAHNSHVGDARATEMGRQGDLNVGQLARSHFGDGACLIGMTTFSGSVTAARDWDDPAEHRRVLPARPGSVEALLHTVGMPAFWLDLRRKNEAAEILGREYTGRAIGVVYRPETERWSHYFHTVPARQFDLLVHIDHTRALQPLDGGAVWRERSCPDTFPSGE